jgi:hypothetical protein
MIQLINGKWIEQTILKRSTNPRKTHVEMFNILNHIASVYENSIIKCIKRCWIIGEQSNCVIRESNYTLILLRYNILMCEILQGNPLEQSICT